VENRIRASFKTLIMAFVALSFFLSFTSGVQAAPLELSTSRIYGQRQIDTAIAVSQTGWRTADTVIIANSEKFQDALVAVPLSHRMDAPILLNPPDALENGVLQEIQRLRARKVILIGGEAVLKPKIIEDLEKANFPTERIWGNDQFETAAKVAERLGSPGEIILANGDKFQDALAVSAYAGVSESPILLTRTQEMPEITRTTLNKLQAEVVDPIYDELRVLVIGGEAVVSAKSVEGLVGVRRLAGYDQYETAYEIVEYAKDHLNSDQGYFVTGQQFPDGLVAGAIAAKGQAQLFMSESKDLPGSTYKALSHASDRGLKNVFIIGGPAVISEEVNQMVQGKIPPKALLANLSIVIDPGHGGPDPGAIGVNNSYEKNNTLPTGMYLAGFLRAAGAQVILTRTGDYSPATGAYDVKADLQARVDKANNAKSDLFISIHNDAATSTTANGSTTYFSSYSPVADASHELGLQIQEQLIKALGSYDRGVKDANFYVIKNTQMPSVLIELGFITHPEESKLLASSAYQEKAMKAVYQGILRYLGY
jgi:N-acetylmuramoyl-L-alanine amidase